MRLVQVCMEPGIAGEHTHKAGETQLHANTHRKLKPGRRRGPQGLCYFACSMPLGDEDVNSPREHTAQPPSVRAVPSHARAPVRAPGREVAPTNKQTQHRKGLRGKPQAWKQVARHEFILCQGLQGSGGDTATSQAGLCILDAWAGWLSPLLISSGTARDGSDPGVF